MTAILSRICRHDGGPYCLFGFFFTTSKPRPNDAKAVIRSYAAPIENPRTLRFKDAGIELDVPSAWKGSMTGTVHVIGAMPIAAIIGPPGPDVAAAKKALRVSGELKKKWAPMRNDDVVVNARSAFIGSGFLAEYKIRKKGGTREIYLMVGHKRGWSFDALSIVRSARPISSAKP